MGQRSINQESFNRLTFTHVAVFRSRPDSLVFTCICLHAFEVYKWSQAWHHIIMTYLISKLNKSSKIILIIAINSLCTNFQWPCFLSFLRPNQTNMCRRCFCFLFSFACVSFSKKINAAYKRISLALIKKSSQLKISISLFFLACATYQYILFCVKSFCELCLIYFFKAVLFLSNSCTQNAIVRGCDYRLYLTI